MAIKMICTCGAHVSGRTEYEAEVKFDLHDCTAPIQPMARVDQLKVGQRFKFMDDRAQPIGRTHEVTGEVQVGPGATHLSQVSQSRAVATVSIPVRGRTLKTHCLEVVALY